LSSHTSTTNQPRRDRHRRTVGAGVVRRRPAAVSWFPVLGPCTAAHDTRGSHPDAGRRSRGSVLPARAGL